MDIIHVFYFNTIIHKGHEISDDIKDKYEYGNKPNEGVNEHATELNDNPTQSCPPFNGDGLLHVRARILQPSPVGLEQGDHAFQFDHPPSTSKINLKKKIFINLRPSIQGCE